MSVIFGIHETNRIIIVADKREYNARTKKYNDSSQKLFEIDKNLCIAIAGNVAISSAVIFEINMYKKETRRKITTDDLTVIIKNLYDRIIEKSPSLLKHSFCCIYGGIGKDGTPNLICGKRCKEGYIFNTVSHIIFNPADMDIKECNEIFVKNYTVDGGDFSKTILQEVSRKSKFVSSCGDKWVFDIQRAQGMLTKI